MSLQCVYNRQLVVHVVESSQQVFITAKAQGAEPQLQFCMSVLKLGPCQPFSTEVEAEVTVKNPCSFPIEFYSLEFDTEYLEEEKVRVFSWRLKINFFYFVVISDEKQETKPQRRLGNGSGCRVAVSRNLKVTGSICGSFRDSVSVLEILEPCLRNISCLIPYISTSTISV